ncbi:hypothetical protein NN3_08230 [Nocardia neocaledoniensis NBRC 108232]|uniref:PPE family protein n=1 Tax=Nocardia neocaledoniensis TaxID=236511 RepID=A0A317NRS4_9NOCA|nr:hypothetical protein [Nocardia neocaledoniensis]PWV78046.1 hypothetical protein DFR69_103652 [Nocardia neocaledoniensis]GEM29816.1 hypothetical protein NN3_08230 [Nocardia neocaledoniensis NBRC 108232]
MSLGEFLSDLANPRTTIPTLAGRVGELFDSDVSATDSELTAQADGNRERADLYAANSALTAGFTGEYDPQRLGGVMESFHDMSHARIRQFVESIDITQMSTSIQGWTQLADDTTAKATAFHDNIQKEMERGWAGAAATQALASTKQYLADIHKVDQAARLIANKMAEARSGFQQVKYSVPHESESQSDTKMGVIVQILSPMSGLAMDSASTARAEAAQAAAREVMNTVYRPVALQSDTQVPKVPAPTKPQSGNPADDGTTYRPTGNGATDGTTTGTNGVTDPGDTTPATTPTDPTTATPDDTTDDTSTTADPETTENPDTTSPAATDPDSTAPAATTLTGTPGGSPGSGSPGGGTPGGGGTSGGGGNPSAPGTGTAVPGAGAQNPQRGGTASTPGTGAAGRAGTGGMGGMAPGARGGKDDEDEHKAPDYLRGVHEELLGPDRPHVPPVIGGDA